MLDFCDLIFRTSKKVMIVLAYRSVVDYCSPKTCAAQPTKFEEPPSVNQHTKPVHHPLDAVMTQFVDEPKNQLISGFHLGHLFCKVYR
jgi:hypothetical protein